MPFYEYECQNCNIFEIFQSIKDPPIDTCPKCNEKVHRVISLTLPGQVEYSAKEMYEKKILPDAKRIAEKIKKGDENAAADLFGENKMYGE